MCMRDGAYQAKKRLIFFVGSCDEFDGSIEKLIVDRFHSFAVQRPCVFDALLSDLAETRVHRRVINVRRHTIQNASRSVALVKPIILGPITKLWLFFGIEMIEIAVKLIEAMNGRQMLVPVS